MFINHYFISSSSSEISFRQEYYFKLTFMQLSGKWSYGAEMYVFVWNIIYELNLVVASSAFKGFV